MNDRTLDLPAAQEQELEAPPAALALWRDAALALGASGAQAAEAARTGVIALECRDISAAFSDADGALVLSTALPADWLDDAATRRDALRASVPLMARSGVTIARTAIGPALMCRWSLGDRRATAFAAWLREFAALANLVTAAVPQLAGMAAAASASPSRSPAAEGARS